MRKSFLFITLLVSLMILSCPYIFHFNEKRELKPYDPQKAGATIVKSYNITGKVKFPGNYVTAEYNNALYIYNNKAVCVFDKDTFEKIGEIKLNIIKISFDGVFSFAITTDGDAFLLCQSGSWRTFCYLDLTTGDVVKVEGSDLDKLDFSPTSRDEGHTDRMGYNMADNTMWFRSWRNYEPYYLFFKYAADEERFSFQEEKGDSFSHWWSYEICSIYGDIYWFNGDIQNMNTYETIEVGIQKFSFENPEEQLHFIDVEYLNTLTIPQSSHYDGEHIWLIVERNNQVQMLKLLPNE